MMNKFSEFIERKVAPFAGKLANQKYVKMIQSVFLSLIPFMTIGSFALIIISPAMDYTTMEPGFLQSFFQGWQSVADFANPALGAVFSATIGSISLYVSIGIGYFLGKQYKMNSLMPVLLSVSGFIIMSSITVEGEFVTQYFEGTGLFTSILASILAVEFYKFLIDKKVGKIEIDGGGVPPVLTDSFASLIPCAIVLVCISVISAVVISLTGAPFPELLTKLITPLVGMVDSIGGVLILSVVVMVFWWFGIHDSVITGPLTPFLVNNLTANTTAYMAGTAAVALPYVLTEPFWWMFMAIGGSGATFGLAILALRSKSKQIKTVGKLALVPAFFNINEPLIFGLPIMLNPIMMFPFVFAMTFNGLITYLLMNFEIIGRTFANPSWNMFAPIGALLSTMDIKALLLVVALIVIDMLIYLPFFKIYEKQKIKEEQEDELKKQEA